MGTILYAYLRVSNPFPLQTGTTNNANDLEENTLIASLCDLIERIWTHAKCAETSHSRCAFWVHLSAYCRISASAEENGAQKVLKQQNENMSPVLAWMKKKIDCEFFQLGFRFLSTRSISILNN